MKHNIGLLDLERLALLAPEVPPRVSDPQCAELPTSSVHRYLLVSADHRLTYSARGRSRLVRFAPLKSEIHRNNLYCAVAV